MTKIDLITGFLGSGKTTFLKMYANYLLSQGLRIGILENDYGAVNVDMMLLSELEGDNCELEMVSGGCCQDCHQRRFKTKLIALGMDGYDRVIVEPSGIFDVDEFFDVLSEEPLNRMYEIGNVIAVVDSRLSDNLSGESDYYLASQIANAGCILLSRSQLVSSSDIDKTIAHLQKACTASKLDKNIEAIINSKNWFEYTKNDFNNILNSGYQLSSYTKYISKQDAPYSSVYFLELDFTQKSIESKVNLLMNSSEFGNVFRVKGFFTEDDVWYEINATKNDFDISKIPLGQEVIIVIGENLNTDKIEEAMRN